MVAICQYLNNMSISVITFGIYFVQQEWIHRYESCGEYMKRLSPEDVIQFINGIVFVEQSLEQVV